MSRLVLKKLVIENFKGIQSFVLDLNGGDTEIVAENGVGKTTVYDSFLFLFFGKDSTGRKEFQLRPLDRYNRPLKGLALAVSAVIEVDGKEVFLRKEHHEKFVKKQQVGFETLCWINEAPKKISEYQKFVTELIDEDHFKLLTDLHFFCEKMHWTDRRRTLMEIAGDYGKPEGFDELQKAIEKFGSIEEFKNMLTDQKKRHKQEREQINPRIDEICRNIEQIGDIKDLPELQQQRLDLSTEIANVKSVRQGVLGAENERQEKIKRRNLLIVEQNKRAADMRNDPTRTKDLQDERNVLFDSLRKSEEILSEKNSLLNTAIEDRATTESQLRVKQLKLDGVRKEYGLVNGEKPTTVCYACGQELPKDKCVRVEAERKKKLTELKTEGDKYYEEVNKLKEDVARFTQAALEHQNEADKAKAELEELSKKTESRLAEIAEQIKAMPEPDYTKDKAWQNYQKEIDALEIEIGEPADEQLQAIWNKIEELEAEMQNINETLAQYDRLERDKARVQDLEKREKELSQLLAKIDESLDDIEQYIKAESQLITDAVNDKFEVASFKMFKELLNGGLEPCCEATYRGVPYADLSFGQQIYVGLDIVNVLSEHYGVSVPLFIDHAESMTLPMDTDAQTILLRAVEGVKTLQVKAVEAKAVA